MHISALQIENWGRTLEARAELPRLVRRLVFASNAHITTLAMPSGASTNLPGWDGEVICENTSPWIPLGRSFLEMSCQPPTSGKPGEDYRKRTEQTASGMRAESAFVFVTALRWAGKRQWREEYLARDEWKDIRVIDADDLEGWLEQCAPVALGFAEELGLSGPGVESAKSYFEKWRTQCEPAITSESLIHARIEAAEALLRGVNDPKVCLISLKGDSIEEAVAFSCAAILQNDGSSTHALVVTSEDGWRYVAQNTSVKIVIAARPEIAQSPPIADGRKLIIPQAVGNKGLERDGLVEIPTQRPNPHEFEEALVGIGLEHSDARRLANSSGRSWSIYRRHNARNPAIRHPAWLDLPQSSALSSICLLGAWTEEKEADKEIVARLAGRSYDQIESDLRLLALQDDAPVIRIGKVWKAKSPLELLDLFADRITTLEIDRFFQIAEEIFTANDPVLQLPDEERYAAAIYGKIRPQSGLLIASLGDTLVKLAVRGEDIQRMAELNLSRRISVFVETLLHDADGIRWLSLASFLRPLAEAAPEAYLTAIEHSLSLPEKPVTRLIAETSESGGFGRCWHSNLLWSLEMLAWAPQRLLRISLILTRLTHVPMKGNWGNTPASSLRSLFRSWLPQTTATIEQRLEVIDHLISRMPDDAFRLLDSLAYTGQDVALPSAKPDWREDDSGFKRNISYDEHFATIHGAEDRMIALAGADAERLSTLISKISIFDDDRIQKIISLVGSFAASVPNDEEREKVRSALRSLIHRKYNFGDGAESEVDIFLKPFLDLYIALDPVDLIVRSAWLFDSGVHDYPLRIERKNFEEQNRILMEDRREAMDAVLACEGMAGVERLAKYCRSPDMVGFVVTRTGIQIQDMVKWMLGLSVDLRDRGNKLVLLLAGLVQGLPKEQEKEFILNVLSNSCGAGWSEDDLARLINFRQGTREVWSLISSQGKTLEDAYWSVCTTTFWPEVSAEDIEFAVDEFLARKRPRTALHAIKYAYEKVGVTTLMSILEGVLFVSEPGGPLAEEYFIKDVFERLENDDHIDRERLARLEFYYIDALDLLRDAYAPTLFKSMMSDPKIFVELLSLVFKEENGPPRDVTESNRQNANLAFQVLRSCRRLPGQRNDGSINPETFSGFTIEARELSRQADRLSVCDVTLGEILAYAPSEIDGSWPCRPVCELLDGQDAEKIRRGFAVGVHNKRGMTSRAYNEGGAQERALAQKFRDFAQPHHNSFPVFAALLQDIADGYDADAVRQDNEALLRREEG